MSSMLSSSNIIPKITKINSSGSSWNKGPLKPCLNTDEVHVWIAHLSTLSISQKEALKKILTHNELQKFDRFHFQADRERFLLGRAGLKGILARYLGKPPIDIIFEVDEFGKPYLIDKTLHFNISHSNDIVVFAISHSKTVGIDVEVCQSKINYLGIGQQFCTASELRQLSQLSDKERHVAFYRCWTRKEAFVKAIGMGLYFPMSAIEVSFLSKEANLLHIAKENLNNKINSDVLEKLETSYWRIEEIDVERNHDVTLNSDREHNNIDDFPEHNPPEDIRTISKDKEYIASLVINKAIPNTCYWTLDLNIKP